MSQKGYIIAVDAGTTNTRAALLLEGHCTAEEKRSVGVRDTAVEGHNGKLKAAVRECIQAVIKQEGIDFSQVKRIVAAGMITSNVGLLEVPHVVAPAGISQLAVAAAQLVDPDICPLPIYMIPGVKNFSGPVDTGSVGKMDIMRGEEVESFALLSRYPPNQEYLFVLPGSHTKFVGVDREGRIIGCMTSMTGELLSALTNHTILADAVGKQFAGEKTFNCDIMLSGYRAAKRDGLGRAAFTTRILDLFGRDEERQYLSSYLMGIALQSDAAALRNAAVLGVSEETTVVVAGKDPLRQAITAILREESMFRCVEEFMDEGNGPSLSAIGACLVAEKII